MFTFESLKQERRNKILIISKQLSISLNSMKVVVICLKSLQKYKSYVSKL